MPANRASAGAAPCQLAQQWPFPGNTGDSGLINTPPRRGAEDHQRTPWHLQENHQARTSSLDGSQLGHQAVFGRGVQRSAPARHHDGQERIHPVEQQRPSPPPLRAFDSTMTRPLGKASATAPPRGASNT